jgi:hypothetical protein
MRADGGRNESLLDNLNFALPRSTDLTIIMPIRIVYLQDTPVEQKHVCLMKQLVTKGLQHMLLSNETTTSDLFLKIE